MTDAPTATARRWPWRAALLGIGAAVAVALPVDLLVDGPCGAFLGGGVGGGLGTWLARRPQTLTAPPRRRGWLRRLLGR